jgi:hypothetical protein
MVLTPDQHHRVYLKTAKALGLGVLPTLHAHPPSEIKARVALSAIRETLAEGGSLGFTREQIRHHFHAAHKERAKWPHRHEAYDEDNQYKAKHPSDEEEARRVLVHEQSWYCCNYREDSIANPIEHLLDPVEPKVFAATISASKNGWGSRNSGATSVQNAACCSARVREWHIATFPCGSPPWSLLEA